MGTAICARRCSRFSSSRAAAALRSSSLRAAAALRSSFARCCSSFSYHENMLT